ncbi:MAG: hypothetical protein OHK0048_11360 [Rhodoferax sp.]
MRLLNLLFLFLFTSFLAACGGGGGSSGTPSGGTTKPLTTSAPASITLAEGENQAFTIAGGRGGYAVTSANRAIAVAEVSGANLFVTGIAAGTTSLTLTDGTGLRLTLSVTVPERTALYTTAPSSLRLTPGVAVTYTVGGGYPAYTVNSTDPEVVRVSMTGTQLSITAIQTFTGAATITIRDTKGTTVSLTVTVQNLVPLSSNAPALTRLSPGVTQTYTVWGGVPGTGYIVSSTDSEVVSATISGNTLSITGIKSFVGQATVVVKDAVGSAISLPVTVANLVPFYTTAPSAGVTLVEGASISYAVGGGLPPYNASTSNPGVASASVSNTAVNITAIKAGTATITLRDQAGTVLTIAVTVEAAGGGTTPVSPNPVLRSATLIDAQGQTTTSIASSGYTTIQVKLTDPSGNGLANQLITVSGDPTQVSFPEGASGLTDASGVASIKVSRASLTASGAGSLTLTYVFKVGAITVYPDGSAPPTSDVTVNTYLGYQLATNNVTLVNLDVGSATLPAYGTRQISVQVNVNGAPATTPVQVNFSTTCGQIAPATASTDSSGKVTVSYSAVDAPGTTPSTLGCSGKTVEISASTTGAAVVTKSLTITASPATNISFVSATPTMIFLQGSGGITQSVVKFKLINARGEPLAAQDVTLSLRNLASGAVKASFDTVGNTSPVTKATDSAGEVSVPVFSGTVPTSVIVNAALVSNAAVNTDSAVLTIASGRPAQARVSLALSTFAIEGFNVDGQTSNVTLSLADRQGNPVPDGTQVNFVTEGGVMIPPVCYTGTVAGNSQCTVTIRAQNPRPANGRVSILAYTPGEEDFVDNNFNNVFDAGDTFTDLGNAFRDDDESSTFSSGEFSVPRAGSSTCGGGLLGVPNTCDGVWGPADVRQQVVVLFATGSADIVQLAIGTSGITIEVSDTNPNRLNNSVPTGSTIKAETADQTPGNNLGCTIAGPSTFTVPNSLDSWIGGFSLRDCATGDQVIISVTSPLGVVTTRPFTIP